MSERSPSSVPIRTRAPSHRTAPMRSSAARTRRCRCTRSRTRSRRHPRRARRRSCLSRWTLAGSTSRCRRHRPPQRRRRRRRRCLAFRVRAARRRSWRKARAWRSRVRNRALDRAKAPKDERPQEDRTACRWRPSRCRRDAPTPDGRSMGTTGHDRSAAAGRSSQARGQVRRSRRRRTDVTAMRSDSNRPDATATSVARLRHPAPMDGRARSRSACRCQAESCRQRTARATVASPVSRSDGKEPTDGWAKPRAAPHRDVQEQRAARTAAIQPKAARVLPQAGRRRDLKVVPGTTRRVTLAAAKAMRWARTDATAAPRWDRPDAREQRPAESRSPVPRDERATRQPGPKGEPVPRWRAPTDEPVPRRPARPGVVRKPQAPREAPRVPTVAPRRRPHRRWAHAHPRRPVRRQMDGAVPVPRPSPARPATRREWRSAPSEPCRARCATPPPCQKRKTSETNQTGETGGNAETWKPAPRSQMLLHGLAASGDDRLAQHLHARDACGTH